MKVYYHGPGHETYHPQLGKLVPNEPFDLDGKIAKPYLESGLLKRVKEPAKNTADKKEKVATNDTNSH